MSNIRFKIPPEEKRKVIDNLIESGMTRLEATRRYTRFTNWYKSHIRSNRLTQKEYRNLDQILQNSRKIPKQKKGSRGPGEVDLSHIREGTPISPKYKPGSGLNFLESWYVNQISEKSDRRKHNLLDDKVMGEAGLPKDWSELFYFWDLQDKGVSISSLGRLENINTDDIIALHRGESVNKVFKRRERLNEILSDADESDGKSISNDQSEYAQLFAESRGLNPYDTREISLRQHSGFELGPGGVYYRMGEEEELADRFARTHERITNPLSIRSKAVDYTDLDPFSVDLDLGDLQGFRTNYEKHFGDKQLELQIDKSEDVNLDRDPRDIGDYGIGTMLRKGLWEGARHWPVTAGPMALAEVFTEEDKYGNRTIDLTPNWSEAVPTLMQPLAEPILNQLGILADKQLGNLIEQRDANLSKQYRQLPSSQTQQLNIPFKPSKESYKQLFFDVFKDRYDGD